eukprot:TRINITY_DN92231_c0_g1_i1.p1 TRINITY_DN92231_c0_g1~~TRINITY_DN92231_c0_g1_i1.p1  ORF type:complete len:337 (-),score=77.93 TRINITY_DN92231_c0_g1_i1:139-1149(-)
MAMARRRRSAAAGKLLPCAAAAGVAMVLGVLAAHATAGSAFASLPMTGRSQAMPTLSTATATSPHYASLGAEPQVRSLGGAAVLCLAAVAAASQLASSKLSAKSKTMRAAACTPVSAPVYLPATPTLPPVAIAPAALQAPPQRVVAAAAAAAPVSVPCFDLTAEVGLAAALTTPCRPVAVEAASTANLAGSQEAASRPRQFTAARRAGSARHSASARRAASGSSFAAGRSERRHVGSRLQAAAAPVQLPVSFDPSKLRYEIQAGLQICSHARSQHGRESKTPATVGKGGDMSTLVGIRANYFVRTRRRNIYKKLQLLGRRARWTIPLHGNKTYFLH